MKYDPRLSGLRGISALGVMLYHTVTLPVIFLGSSIFDVGWVGISMFLMLSMYLLLNSLDANPNLKHYYLRRIKRIWPIYYGVVTAGFLIYHFSAGMLVQYFTFTQYWINPTNGVGALGVFWTLQLEEFMYLIIPFIHSSKRKSDIAGWLIILNVAFIVGLYAVVIFAPALWSPSIYFLPLMWTASYGFGIIAYLEKDKISRWLIYTVPPLLCFEPMMIYIFNYTELSFTVRVISYMTLLPGFAALLVHPPKFLGKFAILGEESYAMYSIHDFFLFAFGEIGVVYTLASAFFIELAVRPKEILKRLRATYWTP